MNTASIIFNYFVNGEKNRAYRIKELPDSSPAWVVMVDDQFGVALPYTGDDVYEEFSNVCLSKQSLSLGDIAGDYLYLGCDDLEMKRTFSYFCADYVAPGENDSKRIAIISNPVAWWKEWKELIGNSNIEKRPYAVLGELLVYEFLLREKKGVKWNGPNASSHDISTREQEYEVKSTVSRYGRTVEISSIYQMESVSKKLFLYFCRFEQDQNGISIDDVAKILVVDHGVSEQELNRKLSKLGYKEGNSGRKMKYIVHEALMYEINEKFPKITKASFVEGKIPDGVLGMTYTVDLASIEGKGIDLEGMAR